MTDEDDELARLLSDGWEVAGYSTDMFVAGGNAHHILLRRGTGLITFAVITNAQGEIGRRSIQLSPRPAKPPKKGFFG